MASQDDAQNLFEGPIVIDNVDNRCDAAVAVWGFRDEIRDISNALGAMVLPASEHVPSDRVPLQTVKDELCVDVTLCSGEHLCSIFPKYFKYGLAGDYRSRVCDVSFV
mgnify:CR=1 FL=1